MNLLDIVIISIMIFLVVRGIFRGFIREIASLSGFILGIWMAIRFEPQVTDYLKFYLPSRPFISLISLGLIFFSVLVSCNILGWVLRLIVKKASMGWMDRTLGSGLALTKGVIIIYLLMVLLTFFLPTKTPLISGSKMAPWIVVSYQAMTSLIPADHLRQWKKKIQGEEQGKGQGGQHTTKEDPPSP
jgi:membrane protein required for colicin V production